MSKLVFYKKIKMMKKILFILTLLASSITMQGQSNTSPTEIVNACLIDKQVISQVYVDGIHYVAVSMPGQDGRLELYDDNCNLLSAPMTLPNYGPSYFKSEFEPFDILYHNGALFFYAAVNEEERAVFKYTIDTETLDINSRISIQNATFRSLAIIQGSLLMSFPAIDNSFHIAVAANWSNPIPMSYDYSVGSIQSFIVKVNADTMSNPELFSHLKDSDYDNIVTRNGIFGAKDGNLLCRLRRNSVLGSGIERDIFFKEIDLSTGDVVKTKFYDGPATAELSEDGGIYLTLPSYFYTPPGGDQVYVNRNVLYKLDADWEVIEQTPYQVADNGNDLWNIHLTDNSVMVEQGKQNWLYTGPRDQQSWIYTYFRKDNLQRKEAHAGEKLERYWSIINQPNYFGKYNFTDNGFMAHGSYDGYGINDGVPSYNNGTGTYQPVQLDGSDLPTAGQGAYYTFFYERVFDIPETFTPQLGLDGVNVYMGKKIVNGVLTDSDEYDSVLAIDDAVNLDNWIGTIIDPSYIDGGEVPGWSVWADKPSWAEYSLYGLGDVRVNSNGDLYVDVAMYDWYNELFFSSSAGITRVKFQRIYLINEENLGAPSNSFDNLRIYPNPTNGVLHINSPQQITSVRVTNILGQTVLSLQSTKQSLEEIDLSVLESGVYTLAIKTNKGEVVKRVVKR